MLTAAAKLTWDKADRTLYYATKSPLADDADAPWLVKDGEGEVCDAYATEPQAKQEARRLQAESDEEADEVDAESESEATREAISERLADLDVSTLRALRAHLGL